MRARERHARIVEILNPKANGIAYEIVIFRMGNPYGPERDTFGYEIERDGHTIQYAGTNIKRLALTAFLAGLYCQHDSTERPL
jgi:hypothetical protein